MQLHFTRKFNLCYRVQELLPAHQGIVAWPAEGMVEGKGKIAVDFIQNKKFINPL
jgi:hypothetical protein